MSFDTLGLRAELLRAVSEQGYTEPTPIQAQAIPTILKGADVLAGAQTGTGKTAGFTLPLLQRLMDSTPRANGPRMIRCLILTPTRELAAQVQESVFTYGKYVPLKSTTVFGGVNIRPQIMALQRGIDILVATQGRLLDHVQQRTVDLSEVEILVLDEADRMLDMGFIRDITRIISLLPRKRQNLLFSATFSDDIKRLADDLMNSPTRIEVERKTMTADLVSHIVHPVDKMRKKELLVHLLERDGHAQGLVFTRTKHGANKLCEQLWRDGITAAAIHGNKSQPQRTKALADFKAGRVRLLVATDIAARGLDIDQLPCVINFELPNVAEDYVHRIGRTGRAGSTGDAISLVCVDEIKLLKDIERLIKRPIDRELIDGFKPDPNIAPEAIIMRRGSPRMEPGRRTDVRARPAASGSGGSRHSSNSYPSPNRYGGSSRSR